MRHVICGIWYALYDKLYHIWYMICGISNTATTMLMTNNGDIWYNISRPIWWRFCSILSSTCNIWDIISLMSPKSYFSNQHTQIFINIILAVLTSCQLFYELPLFLRRSSQNDVLKQFVVLYSDGNKVRKLKRRHLVTSSFNTMDIGEIYRIILYIIYSI